MKITSTYLVYLCAIYSIFLLNSCKNPKVAGEVGTVIAGKVAEGAAAAAVTGFFIQSKSEAKPPRQDLSSLQADQSLAAETRIADIKEAINSADEIEIQAYRNLDPDLLSRAYTGEALQLRQSLVNSLKTQRVYQVATLYNQQFHDFKIISDGSIAKVEMTEKWSSDLYSSDTGLLVGQFPPYDLLQVVYLQKDLNGWRISAISFQSDPPKFIPAEQSPQPTTSSSTISGWGIVCLWNDTRSNISYSYRWGNGDWKQRSLEVGSDHWYTWDYSSGGYPSPKFSVSFDYDMSSISDFKEYDLKKNKSSEKSCEKAKQYRFKYTNEFEDFIDLYSPD